ncbi:MAG: hypothetical protein ABI643_00085 [Candidatus Doudnabacteria bacterium]
MPNKTGAKKSHKGLMWVSGAVIGAALGAGAVVLAESKMGKDMWKQAKQQSKDFAKYLAPKVKKIKQMGESQYKKMASEAMQSYKKNKNLSRAEADHLLKAARASWKHMVKKAKV